MRDSSPALFRGVEMPTRYRLLVAFCFGLSFLLGCKGGKPNPAKVSGKVSYKGAPVTGGTVVFYSQDGSVHSCPLSPDGTYEGIQYPVGDYDVTVETESINPNIKQMEYTGGRGAPGKGSMKSPMPEGRQPVSTGVYVKIPAKYSKKGTSGLKAALAPGQNTKDFDLTE